MTWTGHHHVTGAQPMTLKPDKKLLTAIRVLSNAITKHNKLSQKFRTLCFWLRSTFWPHEKSKMLLPWHVSRAQNYQNCFCLWLLCFPALPTALAWPLVVISRCIHWLTRACKQIMETWEPINQREFINQLASNEDAVTQTVTSPTTRDSPNSLLAWVGGGGAL